METKYLTSIVIGLIILIALWTFINPKVKQVSDLILTNTNSEEKKSGITNPACYATCGMQVSKDGGSYEACTKNCGGE